MGDDTKARMIIGGTLTRRAYSELAALLGTSGLWICRHDADEDNGKNPELDSDYSDDNPAEFWLNHIGWCHEEGLPLILTVDDDYYFHDQHPRDSTDAFDEVARFCEAEGMTYRIRTAGGVDTFSGMCHDREVETHTLGKSYKGYLFLNGRHAAIALDERMLEDPDALMRAAQHAWTAASWPIPALEVMHVEAYAETFA